MLPRIIFCIAVILATLAVILLTVLSPIAHKDQKRPWLALSLYIQQPNITRSSAQSNPPADTGAFIFRRMLTEGPRNTSRIVGKAQGFIIPVEQFVNSAFNIIYFTFDTAEYSGSLSVQAKDIGDKKRQELIVVGGTGSFAFARGLAVLVQPSQTDATYHIKLQLRFPNWSHSIPG